MSVSVHLGGEATDRAPLPAEAATSRLHRAPYLALREVSCSWAGGVLTLEGRLPSYYLKQVAQAAVAGVGGVERVENRIEVVAPDWDAALTA